MKSSTAWAPLITALVSGALLTGLVVWQLNLQGLEARIQNTRLALKKLTLSGGIPPNQDVMDYLVAREAALHERYEQRVKAVAAPPMAGAAKADPQLYVQERFHAVQQMLQRLAVARQMAVPEALGFPKEIPPSETVPRLSAQLELIEEVAALILEQGVTTLASLKVEDPETVSDKEGEANFLMRVPVRVRLTASLAQLMKILTAIERVRPLIDVRRIRIVQAAGSDEIEIDLLLARYLVSAAAASEPTE